MHSARHRARTREAGKDSDPDGDSDGDSDPDPDGESGHAPRYRSGHGSDPDGACGTDSADPAPAAGVRDRATALRAARTAWPMDRQAAATLPGAPEAVSTARRFVRITAAMWQLGGELVDDAELCISELVGNAVTHTDSHRVQCRIWSARQTLFLEVDDEGRLRLPSVATPGEEDEHGRGMLLVETFAAAWGTAPRPGLSGKTVWAALLMRSALRAS